MKDLVRKMLGIKPEPASVQVPLFEVMTATRQDDFDRRMKELETKVANLQIAQGFKPKKLEAAAKA